MIGIGVQYQISTGFIMATCSPPVEDVTTLPEGIAQIVVDPSTNLLNMMFDVTQNPPALIPVPLPPGD